MYRLLYLLILLTGWTTFALAENRVALVIGNADYGSLGRLANPPNDARAMARLLEDDLGFEVIVGLDTDYDAMRDAMTEFGRAARDADVALFFYAGHGVELEGANYMIPVRANIRSDLDLINQGYRLDRVVDLMIRAGAKHKIVLIDACRNNPLPSASTRGARGLQPLYATNIDTMIAFATEPGRVAYDGEGGNSPFTAGLIEYLAKPDIELQSTMRRVRNAVYSATQKRQFPWWDDMFLSDIYLGGSDGDEAATTRDAKVTRPSGDAGPLTEDIALCERIGDSSSPLLLESYLERFPEGFCATAVRKRLVLARGSSGTEPETAKVEPVSRPETGFVEIATPKPDNPASEAYSVSSYWNHNGSLMALSAQGDSRVFYYEQPRQLMENAGVNRGTLLFKGRFSGQSYAGQAYLFSRKCGPIAYEVKGKVSSDFTRVELTGERPVRDENCRKIGTKPDHLVFEYRSKTL